MEALFEIYTNRLARVDTRFVRYLHDKKTDVRSKLENRNNDFMKQIGISNYSTSVNSWAVRINRIVPKSK